MVSVAYVLIAFGIGVVGGGACVAIGVLLGRVPSPATLKAPAASPQAPVRPGARAKPPQPFVPGAAAKLAAEERAKSTPRGGVS